MRLGQLARKLARRPTEIVEFLSTHGIAIDDNSNTKLEDDHVLLIIEEFAPANTVDAPVSKQDPGEEIFPAADAMDDQGDGATEEPVTPEYSTPSSEFEELKPEVIKAPKVELSGLKVIGKIELPEPRKKEQPATITEAADEKPKTTESLPPEARKPRDYKKERTVQRPVRKNPIALQREREEQEAERKKQIKAEQEKEKRTKKYYSKVKGSAPTKRVKMVEEPTTEMSASELEEVPRTWVGRFLKWLKT